MVEYLSVNMLEAIKIRGVTFSEDTYREQRAPAFPGREQQKQIVS